ncbi:cytochrome P450 3A40-like [Polypterus senegalus]|uniref:cytochrome P450 3A40-like n=1 Tax=Polypterus senegalus TaxID=55291 RepID=UPI001965A4BD|nr:cytochrome P450 3A40-like [Polypterus senegalus]
MNLLPSLSTETWTLLVILFTLLALYSIWPYRFFKKLGIPGPTPLPFIGTFHHYRKGFFKYDIDCFKKYGRVWGIYDGRAPVLAVTDTAIIKTVLVKECYSLFTNRRNFQINGPLNDAITLAEDDQWKRIRSVLSPSFTSGRLKEMFPIVKHYGENLVKNAEKASKENKPVSMKDFFGAYSLDVMASCSFSVDVDSVNNPDDPFVTNIKKMLKFSFFNPFLLLIILFPFVIPLLAKLNFTVFPKSIMEFFYESLRRIKADRKKGVHNNRVDFLQLMVDSQMTETNSHSEQEVQKGLTDHEILTQAFIFIAGGYDTTGSGIAFLALNLAAHPEVMRKVQEEIDLVLPNKAPVTYDALMEMEYLEMAINESLRLYPPGGRLERVCKKTVEINGVTIPKGTVVMIPAFALHSDPEYWPEPDKYKPERFSKEMKETMDPYAFLPFGAGPRNCVGMRFAIILVKMAVVQLLQKFDFVLPKETQYPPELSIQGLLQPKTPLWLKFEPRVSKTNEEEECMKSSGDAEVTK